MVHKTPSYLALFLLALTIVLQVQALPTPKPPSDEVLQGPPGTPMPGPPRLKEVSPPERSASAPAALGRPPTEPSASGPPKAFPNLEENASQILPNAVVPLGGSRPPGFAPSNSQTAADSPLLTPHN